MTIEYYFFFIKIIQQQITSLINLKMFKFKMVQTENGSKFKMVQTKNGSKFKMVQTVICSNLKMFKF